ncbi:MAG TPA: hypothetical protein VMM15_01645 [Bradyrhizobium sp.]|nr:hypothetical protein [Bradyrhizobium sp.]
MSNIPLDLQRKCEQRWAARFLRPAPAVGSGFQGAALAELPTEAEPKPAEKPAG